MTLTSQAPESPTQPLSPDRLYRRCRFDGETFDTTAQLEDLGETPGQRRALDALDFAVGMSAKGYNLYVMGSPGLGKHTAIREVLAQEAAGRNGTVDWCYVGNFEVAHKPKVLRLPPGTGTALQQDMVELVRNVLTALPLAFDSDDYRTRAQSIHDEFKEREERLLNGVAEAARGKGVMLLNTPGGYTIAPLRDGEVMSPQDFEKLSDEDKHAIQQNMTEARQALTQALQQVAGMYKEHGKRFAELNEEVTRSTVDQYIEEIKSRYRELPEVIAFLDAVHDDIVRNVDDFRRQSQEDKPLQDASGRFTPFNRYYVNVLVDAGARHGAPVVYEDNPTYQNLIGRIEHVAQYGTLLTDFTLIKPGALHQANGGYLILDAHKLLSQPFAWDALKRSLEARQVRIQSPEQMMSLVSTTSLEPEPIPLDVKIVLVGERLLYYLLNAYDPEFALLFKVQADFAEEFDWTDANVLLYARFIATLQRREDLRPMDRTAVARLIEHAARRAGDGEKLSLHMSGLLDVLREADYWAGKDGREAVSAQHVQQAIDARIHRASQVRERAQEGILRDFRLIDTDGARVGQINALVVVQLGEFDFGQPSRVTATARLGEGRVLDIEREVRLGGATHSKGVLILSSYLANRFARNKPLPLAASLVFEQSYGGVDGDSASVAELCALQSALTELALRQDLAVTGSVNQHGEVQAIGGVNEKIEGFFDICQARGLTGTQGVIIPQPNIKHLMLRHDVVAAAREGRFHVYAMAHVDDAMQLLTGYSAGEADAAGQYPRDSVNGRLQRRLAGLGQRRRRMSRRRGTRSGHAGD